MAGGVGARFWPMSRTSNPKQFIDILGTGQTLIQQTFSRFERVCASENILIVTNERYKALIKEQIPSIKDEQILCEPARRNTAPAVAYAAYKIKAKNENANLIVAPSDHIILKEDAFIDTIERGLKITASNDCLLTLGITPSRPDTGYGYIQYKDEVIDESEAALKKVKTFTEKPKLEMAKQFIESGDFLWNAGIFVWSLKSIINAFEQHLPEVASIFNDGLDAYYTEKEQEYINKSYAICKNISIDYGIMENADNVFTLKSEFGWSDLGTWGSLYDIRTKNEEGNAIVGKNVRTYNSKNCIINMPKDKLVVVQGLDDYIVVEDEGILLICKKEDEQQIRQFVNDIQVDKGDKYV